MSKSKSRSLRPRDARTVTDVCKLRRDNISLKNYWLLLNGNGTTSVTIAQQRSGEERAAWISIPRRDFDRLVDWYMRPQAIPSHHPRGKRK